MEIEELAGSYSTPVDSGLVRRCLDRKATKHVVDIEGVKVAYRVWQCDRGTDDRPNVVLLHGNAACSQWWDAIGPMLATRANIIAIDFTGHGQSQWTVSYDLESWANETIAVIADVGCMNDFILVGHSMGGLVGLNVGWTLPESMRGMILLDAPLSSLSADQLAKRSAIAGRPSYRYDSLDEAVRQFKVRPGLVSKDHDLWDRVASSSFRHTPDGWVLHFDPMIFSRVTDVHKLLRTFPPQTYLVRPEEGLITADVLETMIVFLSGRENVVSVPEAGHNLLLENPVGTARILGSLIDHMTQPVVG